jgi:hypothetical protein
MDELVVALGAIAAFVVGRRWYRSVDKAREPTLIADLAEGPARVVGRARRRGQMMRAPVTGKACLCYRLLIEMKVASLRWEVLVDEVELPRFSIQDPTGEILVDTSGPIELGIPPAAFGSTGFLGGGRLEHWRVVRRIVAARSSALTSLLATYRFEESIVRLDETISIEGLVSREPAPEGERPTLRAPPELIMFRGTAEEPLAITKSGLSRPD